MKTGWKVIGDDAERRIAEFKASNENENLSSYDEAKHMALNQLRDQVAPYQKRIAELEADLFQTAGSLPPNKAWKKWSPRKTTIVIARTKKRARELVGDSRHWFDSHWSECDGDWWYCLANRESLWIEERNELGSGTDIFQSCLTHDEAEVILESHAESYRTLNISSLLDMVDEELIDSGVTEMGTPYTIRTSVSRFDFVNPTIHVCCEIDDGCDVSFFPTSYVIRALPQVEVATTAGWAIEGC